jgi:probable rRNA maturation factor
VDDGGVTVVLADDEVMQGINHQFRGIDRTTDVLAFPLGETDEDGGYIGDVIVSLDRARDQAPRFDNDPETELARLVAHGILHLLGYDHHTPSDGKKMKAAERRALARLEAGSLWPGAGTARA